MSRLGSLRTIFTLAGAYDLLLGLGFLALAPAIMEEFGIAPPPHWGYVHFPALLLMVFGGMFLAIARAPYANRNLIPYGMLLKASYAGVVLVHWVHAGIPDLWKPFAILDLVWLVLFAWAWRVLGERPARSA